MMIPVLQGKLNDVQHKKGIFTFRMEYSLLAQMVKNLPAIRETWVWSLGWEDPLEEGMATHSSIFTWRIHMDRGAWQSMGLKESDKTEWLSTYTSLWPNFHICTWHWKSYSFDCTVQIMDEGKARQNWKGITWAFGGGGIKVILDVLRPKFESFAETWCDRISGRAAALIRNVWGECPPPSWLLSPKASEWTRPGQTCRCGKRCLWL